MALTVYLNGEYLPYEQATLPVEDRSFLFADGVYEVIRVYDGRPFTMPQHLKRLARSAREIKLPEPDLAELETVCQELIRRNELTEATIYVQFSRGSYAPRTHAFPKGEPKPILLVIARPASVPAAQFEQGVSAITVPDQRWARCDIKSVSLLPNILAKQQAAEAGAFEAILIKDGYAIEGSSSNLMGLLDGEIRTYPKCNYILGGITRDEVLDVARQLGYPVREEGIPLSDLYRCTELWVTSTTAEVTPIVQVDGQTIGDGRPGDIAQKLREGLLART